jgi:hypothetical protein
MNVILRLERLNIDFRYYRYLGNAFNG